MKEIKINNTTMKFDDRQYKAILEACYTWHIGTCEYDKNGKVIECPDSVKYEIKRVFLDCESSTLSPEAIEIINRL